MFCMNCGVKLPDGARFCINCGCKLGVVAEVQKENVVQAQAVQSGAEPSSPYFEKQQRDVKVGDILNFGEWHSDSIEWQVLDVKDGKALLLSKYALACKRYHNNNCKITWENCDLRKWLNVDFFQNAFKNDVAKGVVESHVTAHYNPECITDPGNAVKDKVFLLSVKEVLRYFKKDEKRVCLPLSFVKSEGAYVGDNGACFWWLRSPGSDADRAAGVYGDGSVNFRGRAISSDISVVRPACWVDLSKMN